MLWVWDLILKRVYFWGENRGAQLPTPEILRICVGDVGCSQNTNSSLSGVQHSWKTCVHYYFCCTAVLCSTCLLQNTCVLNAVPLGSKIYHLRTNMSPFFRVIKKSIKNNTQIWELAMFLSPINRFQSSCFFETHAGYQVRLYERNERLGGRLGNAQVGPHQVAWIRSFRTPAAAQWMSWMFVPPIGSMGLVYFAIRSQCREMLMKCWEYVWIFFRLRPWSKSK